jgi:hypothetical protein
MGQANWSRQLLSRGDGTPRIFSHIAKEEFIPMTPRPYRRQIVRAAACGLVGWSGVAFAQQPDLRVSALNTSGVVGDFQALTIGGSLAVTVENGGAGATGGSFDVLLFEDANANGVFDVASDVVLGLASSAALGAGATSIVDVGVSGSVQFRENLIHAFVDAANAIGESDENNNYRSTGLECSVATPPGAVLATLQWSWTSTANAPTSLNVMMTPAVVDLDGDGLPEVIFGSTSSTGGGLVEVGVLRALSGATGAEVFTQADPTLQINTASSIAVGDLDGDNRPEIVACDSTGARLICFEHDGAFKWRSVALEAINWGAPAIADLDGDGSPEIVMGRQVLDANGALLWTGTGGAGNQGVGGISCVADVDNDGTPNVVTGNTVYSSSGAILFQNAGLPDGLVAVANFDADSQAEIVVVQSGVVRLVKLGPGASLTQVWSASIPGGGTGGPPTIADYDGDGLPEIGVAGAVRYAVFEHTGALKWEAVTQDSSSNRTGSSVFDFNGDGAAEVVYRDELFLRIYAGATGAVLFQTPMSSCTWYEYVLVADVDADAQAEIVAVANNNCGFGVQRGVFVFGATNGDWVPTRRVWNQHTYHITNVGEGGSIPPVEANNWLTPAGGPFNNYRQNVLNPLNPGAAADLTASFLRSNPGATPPTITARIGNGGDAAVGAGLPVAFYDGDPSAGGNLLGVANTSVALAAGEFEDVTLNVASVPQTPWVVADDAGGGLSTVTECDETNNVHSANTQVMLVCPPAFFEVWNGGIPAGQTDPSRTGTASYFSACPQGATLSYSDVSIVPNTPSNPGAPEVVITRRWTLVDGCGASLSCDQIITLLSPSGLSGLTTLDVGPGQCPNVVAPQSHGATTLVATGTWLHGAAAIVPSSLRLRRADGRGATLNLAAFPVSLGDVTRPHVGYQGGCTNAGGEGHVDLVLSVSNRALGRALRVRDSNVWVELELSGQRTDGTSFVARDLVLLQ